MDDLNKQRKREIRQALLGNLDGSDNCLTLSLHRLERLSWGVSDGAGGVLFFGVMHRQRFYRCGVSPEKEAAFAKRALGYCGRKLILPSFPEAETVFCSFVLSRPVVMIYELGEEEKESVLSIWTGRGISSFLSILWAAKRFEEHLPAQIRRVTRQEQKETAKK